MEVHVQEQMLFRDQRTIKVRYLFGTCCRSMSKGNRHLRKRLRNVESRMVDPVSAASDSDALSTGSRPDDHSSLYFNPYCHNQYSSKLVRLPHQTDESCACDDRVDKPVVHRSWMKKLHNLLILTICLPLLVFPSVRAVPTTISSIRTLRSPSSKTMGTTVKTIPSALENSINSTWGLCKGLREEFLSITGAEPGLSGKEGSETWLPTVPAYPSPEFDANMEKGLDWVLKDLYYNLSKARKSLVIMESQFENYTSRFNDTEQMRAINISNYVRAIISDLHLENQVEREEDVPFFMPEDQKHPKDFHTQLSRDTLIINHTDKLLDYALQTYVYFKPTLAATTTPSASSIG